MFNVKYDDVKLIKTIRATALANLASGVVITTWSSEGSTFSGQVSGDTKEVLLATEAYLDEYNSELVTETRPNFNTF